MNNSKGLLCIGGRLKNAPVPEETKHPILLPHHHVSDLIIRHYHINAGHVGVERTLAETRQSYWIIRERAAVKRVLSRSIPCKKLRSRLQEQVMADLPEDRVVPNQPSFSHVGVDYFGPFMVKQGRKEVK